MNQDLQITANDALIVVDPQNDFLPGGALAVPAGSRIFTPINSAMRLFTHVFATRDWHPPEHTSFARHGGPWPVHCVKGTTGADFSPMLDTSRLTRTISKGIKPDTDGYSGFADTLLDAILDDASVNRVFICGLATDYCVRATALDAKKLGYEVVVLTDAIAAVNAQDGDETRALNDMVAAGCTLAKSYDYGSRPWATTFPPVEL